MSRADLRAAYRAGADDPPGPGTEDGPRGIIFKLLIPGMDVAGEEFRRNEIHVSQVLLSVRPMYAGLDLLTLLLTWTTVDEYLIAVVIGGAPVRQAFCDENGGDGYAREAKATLVRARTKTLMGRGETP